MTVRDVMLALNADLICGEENLDTPVHDACGSDMMSDVLAFVKNQTVLLTGLVNIQMVRTADMMDEDMPALARRRGMVLLSTPLRMFEACGILWENGLRGGSNDSNAEMDL